jgi:hypothetical protein
LKLLSVVLLASLAGASGTAPSESAEDKAVLRLHAFAVDMSGAGRARAGALEIAIERWSTDEERDRLRAILIESGADALLSALQKVKPPAGYIRTSSSLGWDIHYAREEPVGDGGRRVIIATDRPMSFWELRNQPRSVQYDFTLAVEPVRLTEVRVEGPRSK